MKWWIMMAEIGQELELEITDLNVDGGAVARHEGRVYFVDRGLPGEKVLVRVTGAKKRALLAVVLRSLRPSPDQAEPFCEYFGTCGGCAMQNLAYPAQLRFKQRRAAQVLSRIGGADLSKILSGEERPEGEESPLPRILPSPRQREFRNKMEYAFGPGADGVSLGLRRRASRGVLEIEGCPLQSARAGAALRAVRDWARKHSLSAWQEPAGGRRGERAEPFDKDERAESLGKDERAESLVKNERADPSGMLRYLVVREPEFRPAQIDNSEMPAHQLSVELICGRELPPKAAVAELWETLSGLGAGSFVLSRRFSRYALAKGEQIIKTYGPQTLWEQFGPLLLEFPLSGFSQTNTGAAALLYAAAGELAARPESAEDRSPAGKRALWDAYSGAGALALYLAGNFDLVVGLERDTQSVTLARANAERLGLEQCAFVSGDAAALMEKFLAEGRVMPELLVTDPPRDGMSERMLAAIKKVRPAAVVYVSCDPATLARDLAALAPDYELRDLALIDMFPHTPHVETVVRLELVSN